MRKVHRAYLGLIWISHCGVTLLTYTQKTAPGPPLGALPPDPIIGSLLAMSLHFYDEVYAYEYTFRVMYDSPEM